MIGKKVLPKVEWEFAVLNDTPVGDGSIRDILTGSRSDVLDEKDGENGRKHGQYLALKTGQNSDAIVFKATTTENKDLFKAYRHTRQFPGTPSRRDAISLNLRQNLYPFCLFHTETIMCVTDGGSEGWMDCRTDGQRFSQKCVGASKT